MEKRCHALKGVFDFKIKNPNFKTGFKNMTKVIRGGTGWQRSTFTTPAIQFKNFPMTGVVNDGH